MHNLQTFFAYNPEDTAEIRLEKFSVFLVSVSCCLAAIVWTAMYYFIFGIGFTMFLPFCFIMIVGGALIFSHITKKHIYLIYTQILCIMYITVLIQWSIGGVFDSGFVLIWSFIGPMTALMFFSFRKSLTWFALYAFNLVITIMFNDYFSSHGQIVPETIKMFLLIMNMGIFALIIFIFAGYFVTTAADERERANNLLLSILPKKIAELLKTSEDTIADRFDSASVLFADIVGSTPLFAGLPPAEVVDWLNEIFSAIDELVEKYGLEKIRTMGDGYMVASGVPRAMENHAQIMALFSMELLEAIDKLPPRNGQRVEFRVGINSGPLIAGVIGKSKFHYDVWGDTVNVASRMESHGEVGRIQISETTYTLIKENFECVSRGKIDIKGKGEMATWFLTGKKTESIL